jgi:PAS domain S-box-containing protein
MLMDIDHFRAIAELHGDVAWIVDCNTGLPTYISDSVLTLLGYTMADFAAQLSGQDDTPLAPLCAGLGARLQRFAGGDQSRRKLVRLHEVQHRKGGLVPLEITSTILVDQDGGATVLVGVLRDIRDRHERAEQQRRFASMLNHEFRTPLSTIDGAIQRLEACAGQADEATRQRYRKISGAVDRLIGMLDDYLSPDTMLAIGQSRPPDSIAPAQLLDEAAQQVRAVGRSVSVSSLGLPETLRGQPQALRLALKVLVDNALTYSPEDSPIELSGRPLDGGIALSVRDHGGGVPAPETATIFAARCRGSNAKGSGSGLGLYMAASVLDVLGGKISVQNVAPSGAEFQIWLPGSV